MFCSRSLLLRRDLLHRLQQYLTTVNEQEAKPPREFQQPEPIAYRSLDGGVMLGETASYAFAVPPQHQRTVLKQKDLFIHHAWTPASLMLHDHLHLFSIKTPIANRRQNYTAFQKLLQKKFENAYKKCKTPTEVFHISRRVQIQTREFEDRVGMLDLDDNEKIQHYAVWHPFRDLLSRNTQKNYESKGIQIELLRAHIYPVGKVWLPTRQNYLSLLDKYLTNKGLSSSQDRILDVGCGSGILSFMLAKRASKNCKIIGIDINPQAVLTSNMNASRLKIENFNAMELSITGQTDYSTLALTNNLPKSYSLIISNPPWIVAKKLSDEIGLEDGVYDYKQQFLHGLLAFTKKYLKKDGRLLLFYSTLSQELGLIAHSVESVIESHGLRVSDKLETGYIDKLEAKDPLALYKQRSKIQLLEVRHPAS